MNKYETRFFAKCPNNGIRIEYHLTIETEKFETLLKDLKVGYNNQLAQLKGGLEQMLAQREQLNENIPLLKAEIKKVEDKLDDVTNLLPEEEEE